MLFITKKNKEDLKFLRKIERESERNNLKKLRRWRIGLVMMFVSVLVFLFGLRFSGVINTVPLICLFLITIGLVVWTFLMTYFLVLLKLSGRIKVDKEKDIN